MEIPRLGLALLLSLPWLGRAETNEEFGARLHNELAEIRNRVEEQKKIPQRPIDEPSSSSPGSTTAGQGGGRLDPQYDAVHQQVLAAWQRHDWPETLRLLLQQQALRDGPNVRADIANIRKVIADDEMRRASGQVLDSAAAAGDRGDWRAASALYHQALATWPGCLDDKGKRWVQDLDQRLAAAGMMQQSSDAYSKSLSAAPASPGLAFADGAEVVVEPKASSLPPAVDNAISGAFASAPVGVADRVRRGFEAASVNDWNLALAWFKDAQNHDPQNAALANLVAAARSGAPLPAAKPTAPPAPVPELTAEQQANDAKAARLQAAAEQLERAKASAAPPTPFFQLLLNALKKPPKSKARAIGSVRD